MSGTSDDKLHRDRAFELFARIVSQPGPHPEPKAIAAKCYDLALAFSEGMMDRANEIYQEKIRQEQAIYERLAARREMRMSHDHFRFGRELA